MSFGPISGGGGGGGGGGDLGTAAYLDAGTADDELILGNDPRLTNRRTPSLGSTTTAEIASNAGILYSQMERLPLTVAEVQVGVPSGGWFPTAFSGSYAAPAQDRIYWGKPQVLGAAKTLQNLSIRLQANFPSGKHLWLVCYDLDPDTGLAKNLLAHSGSLLADSGAPKSLPGSISLAMPRGVPFRLGVMCDGNAGSVGTLGIHTTGEGGVSSATSTSTGRLYSSHTYGTPPSTAPAVVWEAGNPFCPVAQVA